MANLPWFKFFAADYMLDSKVDALPLDARGLLISMWSLCHLEGSCPADPDEIARKTRIPAQCVSQCVSFFDLRNGRLYSHRMEGEKARSASASASAQQRWKQSTCVDRNANRNANRNAKTYAQSQSQSQSQSQDQSQKQNKIKSVGANAPASRATQLPEGFQPNENHKRLAEELGVDLESSFPAFCDYHKSKGSTFKDWNLALNTWVRRERNFKHGGANGNRTEDRQSRLLAECEKAINSLGD